MRIAILLLAFTTACAAKLPVEEHDAMMQKQAAEYEGRLRRAEEDCGSAMKTAAQERADLQQQTKTAAERIEQLEGALGDKQRTLDDVTSQLLELQDAFSKLSSKERTQIESLLSREKAKQAALAELEARFKAALKEELAAQKVEIATKDEQVTVRFKDGSLFAKGSSRLAPASKAAIDRFAEALKASTDTVARIEAHTDSVRPKDGEDTWALTQQQGLAIAQALAKTGVDPTRLAYVSYGQFRPIATNDTAEGRTANRRVEIVLAASRGR